MSPRYVGSTRDVHIQASEQMAEVAEGAGGGTMLAQVGRSLGGGLLHFLAVVISAFLFYLTLKWAMPDVVKSAW